MKEPSMAESDFNPESESYDPADAGQQAESPSPAESSLNQTPTRVILTNRALPQPAELPAGHKVEQVDVDFEALARQQEQLVAAQRSQQQQHAQAAVSVPNAMQNYPEIKGMAVSGSIYMHPDVERLMYGKERIQTASFDEGSERAVEKQINDLTTLDDVVRTPITQEQKDRMQELTAVRSDMQNYGAARRLAQSLWDNRGSAEDYGKQWAAYQRGLRFFHPWKYDTEILKMPGVSEALAEIRSHPNYFKRPNSDAIQEALKTKYKGPTVLENPVTSSPLTEHQIESAVNMAENYLLLNTKYNKVESTSAAAGVSFFLLNLINPKAEIPDPKDPTKKVRKGPRQTSGWRSWVGDRILAPNYEVLSTKTEAETMGAKTLKRMSLPAEAEAIKRWQGLGSAFWKLIETNIKGIQ